MQENLSNPLFAREVTDEKEKGQTAGDWPVN
jgi:hypothetical protein